MNVWVRTVNTSTTKKEICARCSIPFDSIHMIYSLGKPYHYNCYMEEVKR